MLCIQFPSALFVQILPTITIATSFLLIWYIVRKNRVFRRQSLAPTSSNPALRPTQKGAIKTIKTLIIISSGFYLMWLPFFITVIYWPMLTHTHLGTVSDFITSWLAAANSLINPLVYIPTLKSYREALFSLLHIKRESRKITGHRRSSSADTNSTIVHSDNVIHMNHLTHWCMHNSILTSGKHTHY